MNIAFLGDVVGQPGRHAVANSISWLREEKKADWIIADVENVASGSGITPDLFKQLVDAGVDGMTLGDHAFRRREVRGIFEKHKQIIRPYNLPATAWGKGVLLLEKQGHPPLLVTTMLGRLFMTNGAQGGDPFAAVDRVIESAPKDAVCVVEIHAEATSEKQAMGWHCNGRVAAVVGTHTHVPTADARLLPKPGSHESIPGAACPWRGRTAYVTDLGMCGPQDSVLGRRVDRVLRHMANAIPMPFDVAMTTPMLQGVLIEVDPQSRLAVGIERIDRVLDDKDVI